MDLYTRVAYKNSRNLTLAYSTSFGISSRLLANDIKDDIYAIYALVRIADEIVDTYKGSDALMLLDELEHEVYRTVKNTFSANLVVHAFAATAYKYGITKKLIAPFFESMRMDISPKRYTDKLYTQYIHGSAEVVGLMCLRVFVNGNEKQYETLRPGATALGSAYQKVNFLRDLAADYKELGRVYFPGITYKAFDDKAKNEIITDIKNDFALALPDLLKLPPSAKKATMMSYTYYTELLKKLEHTPAAQIKKERISVSTSRKMTLLTKSFLPKRVTDA